MENAAPEIRSSRSLVLALGVDAMHPASRRMIRRTGDAAPLSVLDIR